MENLSPRQQSVLNRVVDTYIDTAHPVGSRFLTSLYTDLYRSSYSPATVRHEMGELEEMGYLTHPHTSAGRIPTDQGYRYYVNHSLREENFSGSMLLGLADDLNKASGEPDFLADSASQLISRLFGEVGVVILPNLLKEDAPGDSFKLFLKGSSTILEKPEFQDLEKVQPLFKLLDEKKQLAECLRARAQSSSVSVTIGKENKPEAFWQCSIVSTSYSIRRKNVGTLAVIGPKRMKYSRIIPLLAYLGRMVERIFEEREESLS